MVVATLLASTVVFFLGDILPRSYGFANPERVALRVARPIGIVQTLLYPVVAAFEVATGAVNRLTGGTADIKRLYVTREETATMVERAETLGVLEAGEGAMIDRVFRLDTTLVGSVTTPIAEAVGVDASALVEAALERCGSAGLLRFPLFEDWSVVGYLNIGDLLAADARGALRELARPALHVFERREIDEVLAELRESGTDLAVVHGAAGAVSGAVTTVTWSSNSSARR